MTGDAKKSIAVADGTIYNIWYNRYQGGDRVKFNQYASWPRWKVSNDVVSIKQRPDVFLLETLDVPELVLMLSIVSILQEDVVPVVLNAWYAF